MIHKGYKSSHGLIQACTLSCKYLVLEEMGVQLEVLLVVTWRPGSKSSYQNDDSTEYSLSCALLGKRENEGLLPECSINTATRISLQLSARKRERESEGLLPD